MLTDIELNEIADVINDYCDTMPDCVDYNNDSADCPIKEFCDKANGLFGPQYPDDTIDAYTWLQDHGYVNKQDNGVEHDAVEHPSHYTYGNIETIDCIESMIAPIKNPVSAFLTGQSLKYLARYTLKNGAEDLCKCRWYLDRLIEKVENDGNLESN